MMNCPGDDYLERFCECRLSESENAEIENHLETCSRCRNQIELIEKRISDKGFSFLLFDQDGNRSQDQSRSQGVSAVDQTAGRISTIPCNPRIGSDGELLIPDHIGLYKIGKKIGSGGMGDVYEAEHTYLKRPVAIKFIRSASITPRFVERFEREMSAAGKLNHPNVVAAYDAGEWAGIPFLVMELLEGMSLKEYVEKNGAQSVKTAARMAAQAALGLQSAHEAGIIHHDVKPANLWITPDGTVKVLDLGLAHFKNDSVSRSEETSGQDSNVLDTSSLGADETNQSRTSTPAQGGTPDYMAPEQFSTTRELDERSDVYSLGCTLYFLLTGLAPFPTDRYPTFQAKKEAHLFQSVPAIKVLSDRSGKAIESLIADMTDKRPEFRVQSMAAVAQRLEPLYRPHASTFALTAGYILPFALGLPGLLVAIYNYRSGSTGHGIGQIVLSCLILALVLFASVGYWLNRENFNNWLATNRIISKFFEGPDEPIEQPVTDAKKDKTQDQEQEEFQASLKKADSGDPNAQLDVAVRYMKGCGVRKDPYKALPWFEKAAQQDNVAAQHNLGILFFTGEGCVPNKAKSHQWFLRAANQGNPASQFRVGMDYAYGIGVEKDWEVMFTWMEKAAKGNYQPAKYQLAKCYQLGEGVEKDEQKAVKWMKEAAAQGYTDAQTQYGLFLLTGYGGKSDPQEGLLLLIKAYKKGSVLARSALEYMDYLDKQTNSDKNDNREANQQGSKDLDRIANLPISDFEQNSQGESRLGPITESEPLSVNQKSDEVGSETFENIETPETSVLSTSTKQTSTSLASGVFDRNKYKQDRFSCLLPVQEQEYFDKKYTKLHMLVCAEKKDLILDYLDVYPEDLNAQDEEGATPLYLAALSGSQEIVDILCNEGADVNLATNSAISPLLSSISHRYYEIFKKLLDSGADPNQPGNWGITPLHVAVNMGSEFMVRTLIKQGAGLEAREQQFGLTPLALAVSNRNIKIVQLLIDKGAKTDCESLQGETITDIALKNGDQKILELLKNNLPDNKTL